jgi:hypothetical protein
MRIELKLRGHILDSLILSKLLDQLEALTVDCYTKEVHIGARRQDPSEAVFVIESTDTAVFEQAVTLAKTQGATEL